MYECASARSEHRPFRRAVATAYAELESRRQEVNDLNVFPVADGDTGDNMAMTMRAVLAELDPINGQMIDDIGRDELVAVVARAALLGARGNSGVILSQIVRGAAEELASRPGELVDPILVSAAFARAADAAYASVRNPAEGTMLSAVRAMAHRVAQDLAHMERQRLDRASRPRTRTRCSPTSSSARSRRATRPSSAARSSSRCCARRASSTPAPTG